MTNPNQPVHEETFRDVLGKILELAWPTQGGLRKQVIALTPEEVKAFADRVNNINGALPANWFELKSWLVNLQDRWLDVEGPPPIVTYDDWPVTIQRAKNVLAQGPDPQFDRDQLAKLEAL